MPVPRYSTTTLTAVVIIGSLCLGVLGVWLVVVIIDAAREANTAALMRMR